MTNHRRVAWNMIWNWAGMAASILAAFFLARILVERLGDAGYGLWILIASLNGYFGLLDLGVRGAVGRNMACARARRETHAVNALLSTALALLCIPALLALLGTGVALTVFFHLFDVPAVFAADVRLALLITGLGLALTIVLSAFDAALWSMQRFDVLNAIDLPVTVLRVALTCLAVAGPGDLVPLAWATLLCALAGGLAKAVATFACDPAARISPRLVERSAVRGLLTFGCWSWLLSVSRMATAQAGPVLIGAWLSVAAVTPFHIAARLVASFSSLLVAGSGVLTPLAAGLHATDRHDSQRRLVLDGGKCCFALALFFAGFALCLGDAFLQLWMGFALDACFAVLVVLTLGELLPLSQWVGVTVMVGKGRHGLLACAGIVENALTLGLAACLLGTHGTVGMAVALAVPAFLCRGVFQLVVVCRTVGVPVSQYVREALLPPLAAAAAPIAALLLLDSWRYPENWGELVAYGALYTIGYASSGAFVLVPLSMRAKVIGRLQRLLPRWAP